MLNFISATLLCSSFHTNYNIRKCHFERHPWEYWISVFEQAVTLSIGNEGSVHASLFYPCATLIPLIFFKNQPSFSCCYSCNNFRMIKEHMEMKIPESAHMPLQFCQYYQYHPKRHKWGGKRVNKNSKAEVQFSINQLYLSLNYHFRIFSLVTYSILQICL